MRIPQLESLLDFLWPRVQPLSDVERAEEERKAAEQKRRDLSLVASLAGRPGDELSRLVVHMTDLLNTEASRRTDVEGKLTAILPLASVAVSLLATALSATTLLAYYRLPLQFLIVFLLTYMVFQVLCALRAALMGLARRGYLELDADDEIPLSQESYEDFELRRLRGRIECLRDHRNNNDTKVSALAVAHCAFRNVVYVSMALALVFLVAVMLGTEKPRDRGSNGFQMPEIRTNTSPLPSAAPEVSQPESADTSDSMPTEGPPATRDSDDN